MVHEVFFVHYSVISNVDKNKRIETTYTNKNFLEKPDKYEIREMQENSNDETSKCLNVNKSQFSLPSVKELAKQFTKDDNKEFTRQNCNGQAKLESKHKTRYNVKIEVPEKEPEIDYSGIPVSEIICNLQQAAENTFRENHKNIVLHNLKKPSTRTKVWRNVENNLVLKKYAENTKVPNNVDAVKFNGKQVHSLTARSISKEFREGLKSSSYQKVFPKIDRISSSGESDQGDIVCNKTENSPSPSIDLKNMKKFWEGIITANSNSTKHK